MRVIIAGTRDGVPYEELLEAIHRSGFSITEVVSGGCRGVDIQGEVWAGGKGIPVKRFPANWKLHGRKAGPLRNQEMAEYAEALIALWDGESSGTRNMINLAHSRKLKVYVYTIKRGDSK